MKKLSGELQDLKDWIAYAFDLLSLSKRDIRALKIIMVLALVVVPGGILLSYPGIYQGVAGAMSGFLPESISGIFNANGDDTHSGVPGGDIIPPWIMGPGTDGTPTIKPAANPSTNPEPGKVTNNNTNTSTPMPTTGPTAGPTTGPTAGPTPTPAPTKPTADFTGTPLGILAGAQVMFTDHSSNSPTSWAWDFGDGSGNSTLQNPAHTYSTAGNYMVTLTVTNAYGSSAIAKAAYVHVSASPPPTPIANFEASPTSVITGQTVTFTDQSSNSPTDREWDFGDGSGNSTLQNPTHAYAAAGVYSVTLTVSNAGGSDTEAKSGYITVSLAAPVASFTANPTSGIAPLTVTFTDTSTGTIDTIEWDFNNDGTTDSTERNPTHTFATGTHTVTLKVTNTAGFSTDTEIITVSDPLSAPVASFTANPTSGIAPLTVTFTDTSTGTIDTIEWDFNNDGITDSTERNPTHTFATGTHTVTLKVTNTAGSDTVTVDIQVSDPLSAPVASFTANPTSGTAPLEVQFTDGSTGEIDSWEWDFNNDGTTDSTERNPTHTFATGTHTVTLKVTNTAGFSTDTETIIVS